MLQVDRIGRGGRAALAAALLAVPAFQAPLSALPAASESLADASLEDLMKIEVTSVSRKRQSISRSAAAVYVITRDDIARSGASTIPDALRMAPGLMVARIDSSKWAISARGVAGRFANKMLVLIDGRTIYSPLYSGVYWDQYDTLLEDVDRIEVIRGPGGAMWGANAVNGVINIITRSAARTQGLLAAAGTGTHDRGSGSLRYGAQAGDNVHWRAFTRYFDRGPLRDPLGGSAGDPWSGLRGGARLDWAASPRDSVAVHGDIYRTDANQSTYRNFLSDGGGTVGSQVDSSGGYALGRWERVLRSGGDLAVQAYVQSENRREALARWNSQTGDLEFQHHLPAAGRHDLLWGTGFRAARGRIRPSAPGVPTPIEPEIQTDCLYSVFAQDDLALVPNRLILTAGGKLQHNSYTGIEIQPNLRLLWTPGPNQSFWAAVSRAVRTPSRAERGLANLEFPLPAPAPSWAVGLFTGNPDFRSEILLSHEVGWRRQFGARLNLDVAAFIGDNRSQATIATGAPVLRLGSTPRLEVPVFFDNQGSGRSGGLETAAAIQVTRRWRVHGSHTWYHDSRVDGLAPHLQGLRSWSFRRQQGQLRSGWDLGRRFSLDVNLYAASGLPEQAVPAGLRADVRLAWRSGESGEWSVGAQDVLRGHAFEFVSNDYVTSSQPTRAVYLKFVWGR